MKISCLQTGPLAVNTWLVGEEGRGFVVDPGGDPQKILRRAREEGVTLEWILLTHAHFDHILGAEGLKEAGLKLAISAAEAPALSSSLLSLCGVAGVRLPCLKADRTLSGGEEGEFAGIRVKTLLTPGHTAGSCCYLVGDALFSGDTLFQGSYGRTDFPGGSAEGLRRSIGALFALPGDLRVCPGHGEETTLAEERLTNPILGA